MAYMHALKPQIIHRDLTTQNILLTGRGEAKIADFGISRFKKELGDQQMTLIGNPRWRAPEITRNERYSDAVDVYGYALVLFEMLTGELPFHQFEAVVACHEAARGQRPPLPPSVPAAWAELVRACWADVPARRPAFAAVIAQLRNLPDLEICLKTGPMLADLSTYSLSRPAGSLVTSTPRSASRFLSLRSLLPLVRLR